MSSKNLSFSLVESNTGQETPSEVTYDSLLSLVNEQTKNIQEDYGTPDLTLDDYIACELDYKENYTKKQLELIADYYGISKRKKKKGELIEEIVIFEKEVMNYDMTQKRKTLWFYMEEINNDSFLSKFLILD
jgi:hypothetical protein|tara:strand:+ start:1055 stop:1450 length:396 start_codon:yes stop_codon:yes gene_type:complete